VSRLRELVLGVLAAAALFAGCAAAVALMVGGSNVQPRPPALSASASLDPSETLFGDRVTAMIDVLTSAPAGSVTLDPDFAPYRVEQASTHTTRLSDARSRIRFVYALSCLRTVCAIPSGRVARLIQLPSVQVQAGGLQVEATWRPLVVFSRAATDPDPALRSDEAFATLPQPPSTQWLPMLVGGLALVGLAPLPLLLRRRRSERGFETHEPTGLHAALALARTVAHLTGVERVRAALEDVAVALERGGRTASASRVRAAAWSESDPSPAIAELTAEIEQETA
jgi:hypothetical protein